VISWQKQNDTLKKLLQRYLFERESPPKWSVLCPVLCDAVPDSSCLNYETATSFSELTMCDVRGVIDSLEPGRGLEPHVLG
jgi:hypothetical protein